MPSSSSSCGRDVEGPDARVLLISASEELRDQAHERRRPDDLPEFVVDVSKDCRPVFRADSIDRLAHPPENIGSQDRSRLKVAFPAKLRELRRGFGWPERRCFERDSRTLGTNRQIR